MNPKQILILEEKESVALEVQSFLEPSSYEIIWASEPQEVLALLTETESPLIVSSLHLQDLDAFTLMRWLVVHRPEARLVVLTDIPFAQADHLHGSAIAFLSRKGGLSRLQSLAADAFAGHLPEVSETDLIDVLSLLILSKTTRLLEVFREDPQDGFLGKIYIKEGGVIHAETNDLQGLGALEEMLGWAGGGFYELEWSEPEVKTLEGKAIESLLISPSEETSEELLAILEEVVEEPESDLEGYGKEPSSARPILPNLASYPQGAKRLAKRILLQETNKTPPPSWFSGPYLLPPVQKDRQENEEIPRPTPGETQKLPAAFVSSLEVSGKKSVEPHPKKPSSDALREKNSDGKKGIENSYTISTSDAKGERASLQEVFITPRVGMPSVSVSLASSPQTVPNETKEFLEEQEALSKTFPSPSLPFTKTKPPSSKKSQVSMHTGDGHRESSKPVENKETLLNDSVPPLTSIKPVFIETASSSTEDGHSMPHQTEEGPKVLPSLIPTFPKELSEEGISSSQNSAASPLTNVLAKGPVTPSFLQALTPSPVAGSPLSIAAKNAAQETVEKSAKEENLSTTDMLSILEEFEREVPEFLAVVVVEKELGVVLGGITKNTDMDTDGTFAYYTEVVRLLSPSLELFSAPMDDFLVITKEWYILVRNINEDFLLGLITTRRGNLGICRRVLRRYTTRLLQEVPTLQKESLSNREED